MNENYKWHLTVLTENLIELAKAKGRTKLIKNMLLRECYGLVGEELHTQEEWEEVGALVKNGEHSYLFWRGDDVEFRFSRKQVVFQEVK